MRRRSLEKGNRTWDHCCPLDLWVRRVCDTNSSNPVAPLLGRSRCSSDTEQCSVPRRRYRCSNCWCRDLHTGSVDQSSSCKTDRARGSSAKEFRWCCKYCSKNPRTAAPHKLSRSTPHPESAPDRLDSHFRQACADRRESES